jgi:hypothetical protein
MVDQFLMKIEEWITIDIPRAEELIEMLGVLLRRSLAALRTGHSVGDEVRHAEAFVRAEAALNGPGPTIQFAIEDSAAGLEGSLPALIPLLTEALDAHRRIGSDGAWRIRGAALDDVVHLDFRLTPAIVEECELRPSFRAIRESLLPHSVNIDRDLGQIEVRTKAERDVTQAEMALPAVDEDSTAHSAPVYILSLLLFYPTLLILAANVVAYVGNTMGGARPSLAVLWNGLASQMAVWPTTALVIWLAGRPARQAGSPNWLWRLIALAGLATVGPTIGLVLWRFAGSIGASGDSLRSALRVAAISHDRTTDFLTTFGAGLAMIAHTRREEFAVHQADVVDLQNRLHAARIELMRLQLNPHFLFNALNSVSALLDDDPLCAREMASQLRRFLTRVLDLSSDELVPLAAELVLLDDYVAIQKTRFGPRLTVSLELEPGTEHCLVPPLLLQPLVENAIKHGLEPVDGGRVAVTATLKGTHLVLSVHDDGVGAGSPCEANGIGLAATRMRLQSCYGDRADLRVDDRSVGYSITLTIPIGHDERIDAVAATVSSRST